MAIIDSRTQKRQIDLSGPGGNAFALLGTARSLGKQLGYTREELTELSEKMTAGDYENLIRVFDEHFGMIVDLIR